MKNLFFILTFVAFAFTANAQVKTDAQLILDDSLNIRKGTYDPLKAFNMHKAIIKNKVNSATTVNSHALTGNVTVSKSDVGLGNADNTSDVNKPVSTAQQTALDLKTDKATTVNGHALSSNVTVTKSDVGLGNADNTSDVNKPVSTAQQTALDLKTDKTTTVNGHALSSNVTVTKSDVGLSNVDNTSDASKPVSTLQQAAIDAIVEDVIVDGETDKAPSQDAVYNAFLLKADTSYVMKRSGWSILSGDILTYGHGFRETHIVGSLRIVSDDSVVMLAPNSMYFYNSNGTMNFTSDDMRFQNGADDAYFSNISGAEIGSNSGSNSAFIRSVSGNYEINAFVPTGSVTHRIFNTGSVSFVRSSTTTNSTQLRQSPTTGISLETSTSGVGALTARLLISAGGAVTWTLGSDASGDMWYRNSSGNMTRIAAGAQNTILTMGASNVPSWSQTVLSGTYTPTLTGVANVAASTAYLCTYMRVGSTVTVSGRVDIDPTTTLTSTQLGLTLPVASALTTANQLGGTAAATSVEGLSAAILSDATNDRAQIQYVPADVTNHTLYFTFTYQVL